MRSGKSLRLSGGCGCGMVVMRGGPLPSSSRKAFRFILEEGEWEGEAEEEGADGASARWGEGPALSSRMAVVSAGTGVCAKVPSASLLLLWSAAAAAAATPG